LVQRYGCVGLTFTFYDCWRFVDYTVGVGLRVTLFGCWLLRYVVNIVGCSHVVTAPRCVYVYLRYDSRLLLLRLTSLFGVVVAVTTTPRLFTVTVVTLRWYPTVVTVWVGGYGWFGLRSPRYGYPRIYPHGYPGSVVTVTHTVGTLTVTLLHTLHGCGYRFTLRLDVTFAPWTHHTRIPFVVDLPRLPLPHCAHTHRCHVGYVCVHTVYVCCGYHTLAVGVTHVGV